MNKDNIIDIEDLTPDAHNFNQGTDEGRQLMQRSLTELGAGRSILVDRNGNVIAGNKTQEAAIKAGIRKVRVIETDGTELVAVKRTDIDIDSAKGRELALVDNLATQVNLAWDEAELEAMDVEGFDPGQWGWEPPEMGDNDEQGQGEQPEAKEDDFDPDKDMNDDGSLMEQGDIYILGRHRLMCGDSTNRDHIERLMDGETPDLVFTDPPYGISVVSDDGKIGKEKLAKAGIYMPVKGDETTDTAKANYELLKGIGCQRFILWGGNYFVPFLPYSPSWIIWDKRGDMNSNNFADGEMAWCSFKTPVRIYKQVWAGMIREGESEKRIHPTQKPIRLLGEIMKDFSKDNDRVLDCFGGSGSTLIACEQINRSCYMIEYEPHYVKLIIARWEKLTGGKATKLNP